MAAWRYKISLLVLKIFHLFTALTREYFSTVVSPRGHVISSIYTNICVWHFCKTHYHF